MFSTVAARCMTVSKLLGTVTLHVPEKSSKYAAILWLISSQLEHEVIRIRECGTRVCDIMGVGRSASMR
jgi:hypothetical protein